MSLAIAFCTHHGIVMGADHCITSTNSSNENYCVTMQERKLFLSSDGFGFTFTGSATYNNRPVSYWMDRFIQRFSNTGLNVSDFTKKLCIAFHTLDSTKNTIIIGAGFQNNVPQVYSCNSTQMQITDHLTNASTCIAFSGETTLARPIIDALPISRDSFTIPDATDFIKHVILTVSNIQKFGATSLTVSPDCDVLAITQSRCEWIIPPAFIT